MTDRLEVMMQKQLDLQIENMGFDPRDLDPEGRKRLFLEMAYALTDELHEAGNEISWKSWAKAEYLNRQEYGSELVDAWHFFMVLWFMRYPPGTPVKIMAADFYEEYREKREINVRRQLEGYTGIKCPDCHREVELTIATDTIRFPYGLCPCGTTYNLTTGIKDAP